MQGVLDDQEDITLVSAIVALAQAFERDVAAEGVKTIAQGQRLLALGCELGAGLRHSPAYACAGCSGICTGLQNVSTEPMFDAHRSAVVSPLGADLVENVGL